MPVDYDKLAQANGAKVDYDALAQQHGALPETPPEQSPAPQQSMLQQGLGAAKNVGIGLLKGAGSTMSAADDFARQHLPAFMTNTGMGFGHPENIPAVHQMMQPQGTAQAIGKGIEQAGEFLIPGPGEAKMAAAPLLARTAYQGAKAGLINKAQGGSFGAGAAMGAGGEGLAAGMKAVAPGLAESALNIRKTDRAYKAPGSIGKAILSETPGVRPGTVADSAQGALNNLTPQLENAARNSRNTMSLIPARQEIGNAQAKAVLQNEPTTARQLSPMLSHLQENFFTGRPYGADVPPIQGLQLKRGFGNEFVHNWNPETMEGVKGTAARTYHQLGEEFNNAVPEARELNSRISNLIPVAKRAESAELNAPTSQRIAGRVMAHTGALAGAGIGGAAGYHRGGLLGGVSGAALGLIAPEMLGSPTGQMIGARALNSSAAPRLIRGAGGALLQAGRNIGKSPDQ